MRAHQIVNVILALLVANHVGLLLACGSVEPPESCPMRVASTGPPMSISATYTTAPTWRWTPESSASVTDVALDVQPDGRRLVARRARRRW